MRRIAILGLALLLPIIPALNILQAQGDIALNDWPQWRGPDRSGNWYNGPRVESLSPGRIEKVWEVPVESGYCGPTISGDLVFVMDLVEGKERILCLDAHTGELAWSYSYPVTYSVGYPTGPRASVLIHQGKAYAWGTMAHLHCFDVTSGTVLWKVNGVEQYESRIPTWGMASNPTIVEDLLVVQVGGTNSACMVAFHKDTGKEVWRALDDEPSYVAPVLIKQAGKEVLVCWTGESITGLNPENGSIYWSVPFTPLKMIMNVADPVYEPPYLFLSGFFDGSYLLKLGQDTVTADLLYHRHGSSERATDALHCCISTPVIRDGYIYGIDAYGETRCLELLTGDRIWEDLSLVPRDRWANVHLVMQGEKVWGFNETGELLLGKFTPEGYQDLGRARVIDPVKISPHPRNGVTWAHPAFSGDRIYLRNDRKLVCIRVK